MTAVFVLSAPKHALDELREIIRKFSAVFSKFRPRVYLFADRFTVLVATGDIPKELGDRFFHQVASETVTPIIHNRDWQFPGDHLYLFYVEGPKPIQLENLNQVLQQGHIIGHLVSDTCRADLVVSVHESTPSGLFFFLTASDTRQLEQDRHALLDILSRSKHHTSIDLIV